MDCGGDGGGGRIVVCGVSESTLASIRASLHCPRLHPQVLYLYQCVYVCIYLYVHIYIYYRYISTKYCIYEMFSFLAYIVPRRATVHLEVQEIPEASRLALGILSLIGFRV